MIIKEYGYEYDASLNKPLWEKTKGKVTGNTFWGAVCLRSGRDALKTIAREYEPTMVLMPALACDSMILPFEMYGHTVEYYPLTNEYTVDMRYLEEIVPDTKVLFLYMDYFGIPVITDDQLIYLRTKNPDMIFIEDRTHNLIWKNSREFIPDYTMASLRKWLNVPDGGLIWTTTGLKNNDFAEDTSFSASRLKAQCMRREYFATGNPETKSVYRRVFSTISEIMDRDKIPSRMSEYSYQLALCTDWDGIKEKRRNNAEKLISILKEAEVEFIQPDTSFSDLYVAFKIANRDSKQNQLSKKGIFNTILWPLNEEQKRICPVARETEKMMLAAPCDQRYDVEDMEYIGREMVGVFHE